MGQAHIDSFGAHGRRWNEKKMTQKAELGELLESRRARKSGGGVVINIPRTSQGILYDRYITADGVITLVPRNAQDQKKRGLE